jgi:hypothetical protein
VIPIIPTKFAADTFIFDIWLSDDPSEAYRKKPFDKRDLAHILRKN